MGETGSEDTRSAAEREGIVDQQDAALAAIEASEDAGADQAHQAGHGGQGDEVDPANEGVNPSRPPAEGGREEVDDT